MHALLLERLLELMGRDHIPLDDDVAEAPLGRRIHFARDIGHSG
jgi:hypothetical protein